MKVFCFILTGYNYLFPARIQVPYRSPVLQRIKIRRKKTDFRIDNKFPRKRKFESKGRPDFRRLFYDVSKFDISTRPLENWTEFDANRRHRKVSRLSIGDRNARIWLNLMGLKSTFKNYLIHWKIHSLQNPKSCLVVLFYIKIGRSYLM
jgi:hypothetical protein